MNYFTSVREGEDEKKPEVIAGKLSESDSNKLNAKFLEDALTGRGRWDVAKDFVNPYHSQPSGKTTECLIHD